ncbi:putative vacuolar protein sorting protein [Phaeomoniella chlamydospora]|uniref:Vacuolar protein-sorting-associated protein 36 n=1 Tax=Phaeomoniella chlamydospora TaxID=158046 RepID=A0A0G2GD02_PHACM|nr:putative vacuolar protein sorting protein [Phaeomoniella chlamydospora]
MLSCEICGASLVVSEDLHVNTSGDETRPESPGPEREHLALLETDYLDPVKLSFRAGGEKIFYERLKGAMIQRKWLLRNAPPIPEPTNLTDSAQISSVTSGDQNALSPRNNLVGIAGLERRGLETRKNNERVIGGAFEDLEALMSSAKDIVALAEKFAKETGRQSDTETSNALTESAAALGMVTTKDLLGSGGSSESLYLSELSRNLAEYLTDDRRGVLRLEGGIMSLVDLWAVFNGSRNGVELISPADFEKAASLWEKLKLPVRLRRFKSGLLVVQRTDRSDDKTVQQIQSWIRDLPSLRGVTAQETAQHFGWSVGVASEELEMAEEQGALCREGGIEGLRFWPNLLVLGDDDIAYELSRITMAAT